MNALRNVVAASLLAAISLGAWWLAGLPADGRVLSFSLLSGAAFGIVLQRSRFCFYCITRDTFERRDVRGLLGLLAALGLGLIGYYALYGALLPVPAPGRLPPGAHIGPVSWVLALGALTFGLGMALSGSCISAHLYRLGEGALASPFALLGAGVGFVLGFASWNTLYLSTIQDAPVIWLPHHFGYGGSLLLQLAVLALLAVWLVRLQRRFAQRAFAGNPAPAPLAGSADAAADQATVQGAPGAALSAGVHEQPVRAAAWVADASGVAPQVALAPPDIVSAVLRQRWPTYVGGILVAVIGVLAFLRSGPLGVTAELGSIARTTASYFALLPSRLEGLDGFAGCATVVKDALLSRNGLFVLALVAGSLAAALVSGDFRPRRPTGREIARNFAGGVLMGWGGMLALGCTVGTLLSGIMAGALSGWVFALACLAGAWLGWRARARWAALA